MSPALLVTRACLTVLRFGMHRLRGSLGVFVGSSPPPSPVGRWSRDQSEDGMQVVEMEMARSGGFWVCLKVTWRSAYLCLSVTCLSLVDSRKKVLTPDNFQISFSCSVGNAK